MVADARNPIGRHARIVRVTLQGLPATANSGGQAQAQRCPPNQGLDRRDPDAHVAQQPAPDGCACRKSNPNILVMQSAQDRTAKNMPGSVNTA